MKTKRRIRKAHTPSRLDPKKIKAAVRKVAPKLEWMRAKKDETSCANRRTWESRCRLYKVVESVSKFGLSTQYYAIFREGGETIISRHKKRGPAEKACEQHVKRRRT